MHYSQTQYQKWLKLWNNLFVHIYWFEVGKITRSNPTQSSNWKTFSIHPAVKLGTHLSSHAVGQDKTLQIEKRWSPPFLCHTLEIYGPLISTALAVIQQLDYLCIFTELCHTNMFGNTKIPFIRCKYTAMFWIKTKESAITILYIYKLQYTSNKIHYCIHSMDKMCMVIFQQILNYTLQRLNSFLSIKGR